MKVLGIVDPEQPRCCEGLLCVHRNVLEVLVSLFLKPLLHPVPLFVLLKPILHGVGLILFSRN
jgi:hypothetical protein